MSDDAAVRADDFRVNVKMLRGLVSSLRGPVTVLRGPARFLRGMVSTHGTAVVLPGGIASSLRSVGSKENRSGRD